MYRRELIHINNVTDIIPENINREAKVCKINCTDFNYNDIKNRLSSPVFLNASIAILVLSGTATLIYNYKTQQVRANRIILLSSSHLFSFRNCSQDFICTALFVGKEFMDDMDSTDMIYKRIKYGVRLYNNPVQILSEKNMLLISGRLTALKTAISDTTHAYYKEVILNTLFAFYLDLSNIIEKNAHSLADEGSATRYESIIKSFIELLITNYRKEHKVEFYASELHISTHYLTLIVKRITGQSVSDFIFEMLYSESRALLNNSGLSIQEISSILNFSDQSSFGKFFKRKAGVSPAEYRNALSIKNQETPVN